MRAYVRRGHAGVSFGCLGTLVLGFLAVLALEALAAVAVVVVIALASAAVAYGAGALIRRHQGARHRAFSTRRHGVLPQGQWVYRPDRWPHAVRERSWLNRR